MKLTTYFLAKNSKSIPDLNYNGIIFGKEITYNSETKHIEIDASHYFDYSTRN
jgi:DUF2075 family protein